MTPAYIVYCAVQQSCWLSLPKARNRCRKRAASSARDTTRWQGDRSDECTALSVQEASQSLATVTLGLLGHAGIRGLVKAMIRPRIHVKLDRHPGAA
jgi:hypothetical protein